MPGTKRSSRDPSAALEYCLSKLAKRDGSPSPSVKVQAPLRRFDPAAQPDLEPRGTERLRDWLNRIAELDSKKQNGFDAATAYLALLQVWLERNEISWPSKGVFAADLSGGGKGRPVDRTEAKRRERCSKLRKQGKTWKEIAAEVFPECTTVPQKAQARMKAKDYAKSYSARKDRPDIEDLRDAAYQLLGIEPHPSFDDL